MFEQRISMPSLANCELKGLYLLLGLKLCLIIKGKSLLLEYVAQYYNVSQYDYISISFKNVGYAKNFPNLSMTLNRKTNPL